MALKVYVRSVPAFLRLVQETITAWHNVRDFLPNVIISDTAWVPQFQRHFPVCLTVQLQFAVDNYAFYNGTTVNFLAQWPDASMESAAWYSTCVHCGIKDALAANVTCTFRLRWYMYHVHSFLLTDLDIQRLSHLVFRSRLTVGWNLNILQTRLQKSLATAQSYRRFKAVQ